MDGFLTVDGVGTSLFEDRKSRFYGFVTRITSAEEVVEFRHGIMRDIPEASHYVSAYRLAATGVEHYSDAKEPHGTAGLPVLNVLRHRDLHDVTCVVARVFGGTLLGKGGLMRAYTQAAADAVDASKLSRCVFCRMLTVRVAYPQYDALVSWLDRIGIAPVDVSYAENVTLTLETTSNEACALADQITDFCHARAQVELAEEHLGTIPIHANA